MWKTPAVIHTSITGKETIVPHGTEYAARSNARIFPNCRFVWILTPTIFEKLWARITGNPIPERRIEEDEE